MARSFDHEARRVSVPKDPQPTAAERELTAVVRCAIAASMADGIPTIAGAATAAGLSVRGLQRRLANAGVTYSQLREEVCRDAAFRLIEDRALSLCQVASAIGYSDPSHFTRAFIRWSGMTPRAYRQKVVKYRHF